MGNEIKADELSSELADALIKYTADVGKQVKAATDRAITGLVKDTKRDAPRRTGEYRKHIAKRTLYEDRYEKRTVWYVKKPYYRASHLLERSHRILRNGAVIGLTASYPHIEKNSEKAIGLFENEIKEILKNAGI